jgi:hypothetical protein
MKELVEPDKLRFLDLAAEASPYYVHTVELSDDRSLAQFFTLWVKASNREDINAWVEDVGLDKNLHDPGLFHRDDERFAWIGNTFKSAHPGQWATHYHVMTDGPPRPAFLLPFKEQIPPEVWEEINQ